jgi:SpoU rRNA methylase family enzyme
MVVMTPRETWTDQRLDQFEKRVDERFDRFEQEVTLRFQQVDQRFDRVEADIRELRMLMIGGFVTLLAAIIGTSAF